MTSFEAEYKRLNNEQKKAVDTIDGPLLVVAGPGTGKTQLLALRVANILRKTDVQPYNILCLTYTESGKKAMIERLSDFLGPEGKKVEVNTFHGFGKRLIDRFPDFFPDLAKFRSVEDLTLYETLKSCLESLPRSNPLSKHAYGQFTYQSDAQARIGQFKQAGIAPEVALDRAQSDLGWSQKSGRQLAKVFESAGRLSPKVIDIIVSESDKLLGQTPNSELGKLCLDELQAAIDEAVASGKTASLSAYKKQWFTGEDGKLYFKPIDQMKKLEALAELYKNYENELKKRKLYDYDDMILYALEKLRDNPEFLAQVQESFQFILADEYQDTNAAQASIINLIADNPVNEGRPNVMVVGDDDQAIYGFQGALGDVLMSFRERWRDVKTITLKSNYRSTQSILDTARSIITQGQNRLENHYEDIDKSLNPEADYPNIEPSVIEAGSAEAVVDRAVNIAKSADPQRQIAIIATKHKYLQELASLLDASKVNYYYEGREDLLNDPAVKKLLLLAEMVQAIKQKESVRTNYILPELIALEIFDIARPVAWQIALESKSAKQSWWETFKTRLEPEVKDAVRILSDITKLTRSLDASDSLKVIAKQWNLRVLQKIKRLHTNAVSYYNHNNVSLSELLKYSELSQEAGISLEQTITKGSVKAPVVLLSAHRSKGLEYDRVLILHGDYNTWFKERGRRNNLTLPANWQAIEPLAANTDDKLRLLFVVMTRAKQELSLIKDGQAPVIPGLEELRIEQSSPEQLEAFSQDEESSWQQWYAPKSEPELQTLRQLLRPTLDNYRLSPTHLTIFLDVAHDGPTTFLVNILLGIPQPVHAEAIFGSRVHKCLHFAQDYLNKHAGLPTKSVLETFVEKEITQDENQIADIVETADGFVRHSQILQPGGSSEYNFSSQNINWQGISLTGTVDQFVLKDNSLTITDYKTGRALNSWLVREDYYKQKLHRFRQQLMFYEMLFRLSSQFQADSIASKVAFVEPSRRDIYFELTLDANQKEHLRFEALLQAVWKNITVLNLPDISSYSPDMNGITDFEDQLLK